MMEFMSYAHLPAQDWIFQHPPVETTVQDFLSKITIDILAFREQAGTESDLYCDSSSQLGSLSRILDDMPDINEIDEDYAGRALLSLDDSNDAHLDQNLAPAASGGMEDLVDGDKKALYSDVESPVDLENVTPAVQESSVAATPVTKTSETQSPTDPPYHLCLMAFLVLATYIVVTVGTVVTMLSSLLPSMSLLALVYLLLSQMKLQGEARKAPPTEIDLDISVPESVTSTEKPSTSSMK